MTQTEIQIKHCIVLYGPTRAGKTSFLNLFLRPGQYQQIGRRGGKSTTKSCSSYRVSSKGIFDCEQFLIIDTIGLYDTNLDFTNEQIANSIIKQLFVKSNITSFYIIAFQSYSSSSKKVLSTIQELAKMLGRKSLESCIILATKHDTLYPSQLQKQEQTINNFVVNNKLNGGYLNWTNINKDNDNITRDPQFLALRERLKKIKPFNHQQLQTMDERVQQLAYMLKQQAGPRLKTVDVKKAENVQQERKEKIPEIITQVIQKTQEVYSYTQQEYDNGWSQFLGGCSYTLRKAVKRQQNVDVENFRIDYAQKAIKQIVPVLLKTTETIEFEQVPDWVFQSLAKQKIVKDFFSEFVGLK